MLPIDTETAEIYGRFFDGKPVKADVVETSRDEHDFRHTLIITDETGLRRVIKLADNDFTFPDKIRVWQRAVTEYRRLGYYCPLIFADRTGDFPTVGYKGRSCTAYAEEFSRFRTAEDRTVKNAEVTDRSTYLRDAWIMTARVAQEHFDFSEYPSGYCLFERFCPSDRTDEVLEVADEWKSCADRLPDFSKEQVGRIWRLWNENREVLAGIYGRLPTSVFQADLNPTNILLDDDGRFAGVFDFNLCGRDVFLNYLIREIGDDDQETERQRICKILGFVREYYSFSQLEKDSVLMLYRCLKPLWNTHDKFEKCSGDELCQVLDSIEHSLTADFDFKAYM